jgi:hypothetical protein
MIIIARNGLVSRILQQLYCVFWLNMRLLRERAITAITVTVHSIERSHIPASFAAWPVAYARSSADRNRLMIESEN